MVVLADGVPPAPDVLSVLVDWRLNPLMALVVALAAAAYFAAIRRVKRNGGRWPLGRSLTFFAAGLGVLSWASMGWPEVYGPALFSVYAAQTTVLLMVSPFLIALGRPLELARVALGPVGRARLDRVLGSRAARLFTVPVVSPLVLGLVPFLLFFTRLYPASLDQVGLLWPLQVVWVLLGLAVLIPLWESDEISAQMIYPIALLFAFIELLVDAVPGIVIRLNTHVLAAGYFAALGRAWGPSLLSDQQLGGDLLWCIAEAVDVPFLALLVIAWIRSDRREAARVDRALDLDERRPAASAATRVADRAGFTRPWWETDASVFGNRASQFERPTSPSD
jgi:putative copper resistance protein D